MIIHFFPDMGKDEHESILQRLLDSRATRVVKPTNLADVLEDLKGTSDGKDFKELHERILDEERERLVKTRFAVPRAQAEAQTPSPIKALRPSVVVAKGLPGVQLTYQVGTRSFQGYYPKQLTEEQISKFLGGGKIQARFSTSRTIGDKWTAETALVQVVNWLWTHHRKAGRDIWRCFRSSFQVFLLQRIFQCSFLDSSSFHPLLDFLLCKCSEDCTSKPSKQAILDALELCFKILSGEAEDPKPDDESADENVEEDQPDEAENVSPPSSSSSTEGSSSSEESDKAIPAGSKDTKVSEKKKPSKSKSSDSKKKEEFTDSKKKEEFKKSAKAKPAGTKAKGKAQENKKKEDKKTDSELKEKPKSKPQPLDTSKVVIPGFMKTVSASAKSSPVAEPAPKRRRKEKGP